MDSLICRSLFTEGCAMASAVLGILATSSHRTCWRLVAWIRGRPRDRPIALFSSYLHLKRQLGLIISHIRLSLLLGAGFCLVLLWLAPVHFLSYIISVVSYRLIHSWLLANLGPLLQSHQRIHSIGNLKVKWLDNIHHTPADIYLETLLWYFSRWTLMQCTQLASRNKLHPEYTRISGLHESTASSSWHRTIRWRKP